WTAGVQGNPLLKQALAKYSGLTVHKNGRVQVLPTLQLAESFPEVYVIGDLAEVSSEGQGSLPMVAPVAVQQGRGAAKNILRQIQGKAPKAFHYRDKGMMATIGRNAGVAHLFNRFQYQGFAAWVMWLSVHIFYLIGFRNRLLVMMNWAWSYF